MKPDPKPSALANAINYMNRLVAAGIDYSEAQWRVSQCYPQFSAEELQAAYDSQDEWL